MWTCVFIKCYLQKFSLFVGTFVEELSIDLDDCYCEYYIVLLYNTQYDAKVVIATSEEYYIFEVSAKYLQHYVLQSYSLCYGFVFSSYSMKQ